MVVNHKIRVNKFTNIKFQIVSQFVFCIYIFNLYLHHFTYTKNFNLIGNVYPVLFMKHHFSLISYEEKKMLGIADINKTLNFLTDFFFISLNY